MSFLIFIDGSDLGTFRHDNQIAIVGIAKKLEEIFFPGDQYPLYLVKKTPTLKVIQNE